MSPKTPNKAPVIDLSKVDEAVLAATVALREAYEQFQQDREKLGLSRPPDLPTF
jgi:hypothetical protein